VRELVVVVVVDLGLARRWTRPVAVQKAETAMRSSNAVIEIWGDG